MGDCWCMGVLNDYAKASDDTHIAPMIDIMTAMLC